MKGVLSVLFLVVLSGCVTKPAEPARSDMRRYPSGVYAASFRSVYQGPNGVELNVTVEPFLTVFDDAGNRRVVAMDPAGPGIDFRAAPLDVAFEVGDDGRADYVVVRQGDHVSTWAMDGRIASAR